MRRDRSRALQAHEAEIAKLEAELADFRSSDETLRVTRLLEDKRAALEGLMSRWEEVSAEIEAAAG